jgi:hypothetical protein
VAGVTHTLSQVANQNYNTNIWIERLIICWKVNLPFIIWTTGFMLVRSHSCGSQPRKAYPLIDPVTILMLVIPSRDILDLKTPPASCQSIRPTSVTGYHKHHLYRETSLPTLPCGRPYVSYGVSGYRAFTGSSLVTSGSGRLAYISHDPSGRGADWRTLTIYWL